DRVERIFGHVPSSILRAVLSGFVKYPGFREPHRVPRPLLFNALSSDADPMFLSGIVWGYLEELLTHMDRARVRDVRKHLAKYAADYGEDAVHVALLVHRRPGVRKLVDELSEIASATDAGPGEAEGNGAEESDARMSTADAVDDGAGD